MSTKNPIRHYCNYTLVVTTAGDDNRCCLIKIKLHHKKKLAIKLHNTNLEYNIITLPNAISLHCLKQYCYKINRLFIKLSLN